MPVHKCPNGKYRIGSGKCIYDSKAKAERAYKGYMASKHMHEKLNEIKKQILAERKWIKNTLQKIRKK
jgi:hypothetical protein